MCCCHVRVIGEHKKEQISQSQWVSKGISSTREEFLKMVKDIQRREAAHSTRESIFKRKQRSGMTNTGKWPIEMRAEKLNFKCGTQQSHFIGEQKGADVMKYFIEKYCMKGEVNTVHEKKVL